MAIKPSEGSLENVEMYLHLDYYEHRLNNFIKCRKVNYFLHLVSSIRKVYEQTNFLLQIKNIFHFVSHNTLQGHGGESFVLKTKFSLTYY